jgi:phosphoglycolate phosphatase
MQTNGKLGRVRALLFDLDGTLIDSKKDLILSVNAMLREMGRAELPEPRIASYIGAGAPLLIARALGEAASDDERKRGLEFFLAYYEEHKMDHTRAYPGVAEALEEMRPFPMAILTNKPHKISRRILEAMGLAEYFRTIVGGNSFETKKPDPQGARAILQEFAAAPEEALLVGDSEVDVLTARNAGMLAVSVNYGFGVHDRAAHPADVYLDRLGDLPGMLQHRK